jgi:lipoprotein NlpI
LKKAKADPAGAMADFNQAIALDPKESNAFANRGNLRKSQGDLTGATADYDHAIELSPKTSLFFFGRGVIKRAQGDLDAASADYNHAIELNPKNESAISALGNLKKARGDLDGAYADYVRAIEIAPTNGFPWFLRGILEQDQGQPDAALKDLRRSLEFEWKDKDYAAIRIWLVRAQMGDRDAANTELSAYLDNRKKGAPSDWQVKIARFLLGQISEPDFQAAAVSSDAVKDQGQHCEFWYYAGMKRLLAGDKSTAIADFHQCVATQKFDFVEYDSAHAELKKLGE